VEAISKNKQKKDMTIKGGLFTRRTKRGGRKTREGDGEVNMIKVHCIHVRKCHNETHYFLQFLLKNKNLRRY
jgi:hypothetical protein